MCVKTSTIREKKVFVSFFMLIRLPENENTFWNMLLEEIVWKKLCLSKTDIKGCKLCEVTQ